LVAVVAVPQPNRVDHELHAFKDGGYSARYASSVPVVFGDGMSGKLTVEMCLTCGYATARCEHEHNVWNDDRTKLLCGLCGHDGT
jgi:hypothetical protein